MLTKLSPEGRSLVNSNFRKSVFSSAAAEEKPESGGEKGELNNGKG